MVMACIACRQTQGNTENGKVTDSPQREHETLISETTVATVYNALPSQCNADYLTTASMFVIDPARITEYRILAMERTMMAEYGISYGDQVLVQGAGEYDGLWRVEDTMNKRYAGQHRIDFLVPDNIKNGKWQNVKVYKIEKEGD